IFIQLGPDQCVGDRVHDPVTVACVISAIEAVVDCRWRAVLAGQISPLMNGGDCDLISTDCGASCAAHVHVLIA
ncbi:MAG TPA: hypothetical protein VJ942_02835, partial [Roseovarius sp.]|nr:hypothetical protein [Roseovarius sp.]